MLWGGRFSKSLDSESLTFSSSIQIDIELFEHDIECSIAHAKMLKKINILSSQELQCILNGLKKAQELFASNAWDPVSEGYEDIHSAIESKLTELIGDTAKKIHSGRSRNDQVVTDVLLWIRSKCPLLKAQLIALQQSLLEQAKDNLKTLMPAYTHLQRAQIISFAYHLISYIEMIERDKERLVFLESQLNKSPLGSAALAGSTLELDRVYTARLLNFQGASSHAMDSVSNRDFVLDALHFAATTMMHLSRLSEEIILWTSREWNFIHLPDELTTGSSLMPQKRNSDLAELIRGKTSRVMANYGILQNLLKSLPMAYNRDFQEDKEPLFNSIFTLIASLKEMDKMISGMKVNKERFVDEMKTESMQATDLADYLVKKGIPFRDAHSIVGKLIKGIEKTKRSFSEINFGELKKASSAFEKDVLDVLSADLKQNRKQSFGGCSISEVRFMLCKWERKLN